ncbi:hypothetical protein TanjilG_08536 [Lupinus angustifolius]|uniref:Uncharacterized protein n=1 Tax=Lupinus angustifolius TaxID=3871 RepID=A0A1J7G1Q6_LUPAN|nr:hypothetical protein TanjilG_08536 [Lupinus angustifolius]
MGGTSEANFNQEICREDFRLEEYDCANNGDDRNNEIVRPKGEVEECDVGIIDLKLMDNNVSLSYSSPFEIAEKMVRPMEEVKYDLDESPLLKRNSKDEV